MTFPGQAAQFGRGPGGYVNLPGGYDDAVRAQQQQQAPQLQQQQTPQQMFTGVPGGPVAQPNALPPQMQHASPVPQVPFGYPSAQPAPLPPLPSALPPGFAPQLPPEGFQFQQRPQPVVQQGWMPQQQQAPQQQFQQQPAGTDLEARLAGPNVPPELQGRTVRELVAIHNGLRQAHLQSLATGQGSLPPVPPLQQTQGPQGQQTQGQAPQGPQWDWRNPGASVANAIDERLNKIIDERIAPALAPMQQNAAIQSINTARTQAVAQFGPQRFAQLEPLIAQSLQGIDPRALMNPQTWLVAAERALGQIAAYGPPAGMAGFQQQSQAPGVYPAQQPGFGQQPLPNLNTFFTEQPGFGSPLAGPRQLSADQRQAASLMGMSEDSYLAWSGGAAPAPAHSPNGAWR